MLSAQLLHLEKFVEISFHVFFNDVPKERYERCIVLHFFHVFKFGCCKNVIKWNDL